MAAPTEPKTFGPGVTDDRRLPVMLCALTNRSALCGRQPVALGSSGTQDRGQARGQAPGPGPGRDAAIKAAKTKVFNRAPVQTAQVRGFLIKSYSPAEADVDLAFQTPTTGHWRHTVLSLRWVDGDWKVKASDDGQNIQWHRPAQ